MAAEIRIIIEAEFAPVVALLRWSQLDVQDWAHVKPIKRKSSVWNFFFSIRIEQESQKLSRCLRYMLRQGDKRRR